MQNILSPRQRRKAAQKKERQDHKTRQKLERAMRDNGALGRVTAVQAALRTRGIADKIHAHVREHEASHGKITKYEMLRAIVEFALSSEGFDLTDVMIKFSFGPGCGACNHPHDRDCPCGYPGCDCREWKPAQLLGIAAGPTMQAVRVAARAAGVEAEIDLQV